MFDIPLEKIRQAVVLLIALVLSVTVHEFGHAKAADKLGDGTPRNQGRVTLNPMSHADPIGTILFPMIAFFFHMPLIGWGRPVIVNPMSFTRKMRMKKAHLLVAIAGPGMNVILAIIVTLIYALLMAIKVVEPASPLSSGIQLVIALNWMLFFFNLIPCPPLDGGAVLAGLLPDKYDNINQFLAQYGYIILIGLLITGALKYFLIPATFMSLLFINIALIIGT